MSCESANRNRETSLMSNKTIVVFGDGVQWGYMFFLRGAVKQNKLIYGLSIVFKTNVQGKNQLKEPFLLISF